MGYQLGVDLGTTSTSAAVARGGQATIVQLTPDSQVMPSVISIRDDGDVLCGDVAERRAVTDPTRTIREFKRRFGDPAPIVLGGKGYGADILTGHLLSDVIARTTMAEGTPPDRLGLAHPASWGPFRLDLLRSAAAHAGHDEVLLVPEPVAAAIANHDRIERGSLVAVYDLGGGTFDAAVVRHDGEWDVIGSPEGVERLGGVDFDLAVMAYVDDALGGQVVALDSADPEARAALARLRADCQAAKEALSVDTDVEIPVQLPTVHTSVRLTRADLEAIVRPRLVDSLGILDRVVASAGASWGDISSVLLVGGSSRIPAVAQMVAEHTGRPITAATNPTFAIAVGTALAVDAETTAEAAVEESAPVIVSAPPAPVAESVSTNGSSGRRRLLLGAGALVAVAAVGVGVVALSGGDDASTITPDSTGVDVASTVESGGDTTATPADTATPPASAPGGTDPAAPPAAGPVTAAACSGVPTGVTVVGIGSDSLYLVDGASLVALPLAVGASACTVGADPSASDLPDVGEVVYLGGSSADAVSATGPSGTAVIRPADGLGTVCAEAVGAATPGPRSTLVSWTPDGALQGFEVSATGCELVATDLYAGGRVQAAASTGRNQVLVGGVPAGAEAPSMSVIDGSGPQWNFEPAAAGLNVVGFDAVGRCGEGFCGVDVTADLVVVLDADGAYLGSSTLSQLVGGTVDRVIGVGTTADSTLVVATAAGDTIAVTAISIT